jgi:hypothetical protein
MAKTSTEIYGPNEWSEIREDWVGPHVHVWEKFMGVEVPLDDNGHRCHIHHIDGNPRNNDIHNLVCMTASEHHRVEGKGSWNTGKTVSSEVRARISATLTGRKNGPPSEETRRKIRESNLGKKRSMPVWNKGKPLSEEHKKNMSESLKKPWSEARRLASKGGKK